MVTGSAVTGRDREVRGATYNWPSVVRVREGLVGRDVLVSSRTSDSCGGPGAVTKVDIGMTFSRARTGVVAMRQDSSLDWIPRNWGENGVKFKQKQNQTKTTKRFQCGCPRTSIPCLLLKPAATDRGWLRAGASAAGSDHC